MKQVIYPGDGISSNYPAIRFVTTLQNASLQAEQTGDKTKLASIVSREVGKLNADTSAALAQLMLQAATPQLGLNGYLNLLDQAEDAGVINDSPAFLSFLAMKLQPILVNYWRSNQIFDDTGERSQFLSKSDYVFHQVQPITLSNGNIKGGTSKKRATGPRLMSRFTALNWRLFAETSLNWSPTLTGDYDCTTTYDATFFLLFARPDLTITGAPGLTIVDRTGVGYDVTPIDRQQVVLGCTLNVVPVRQVDSITYVDASPIITSSLKLAVNPVAEIDIYEGAIGDFQRVNNVVGMLWQYLFIPVGDPVGNRLMQQLGMGHISYSNAQQLALDYVSTQPEVQSMMRQR